MNCREWQGKNFFLVLAVGAGVLLWCEAPLCAERTDAEGLYKGVREATLRYVALGTPDDLLRLQEAFDRTEQEIARLELEVPPEGEEPLAQNQRTLKDLKDRLAEDKAFLRLLETSDKEVPDRELDRVSAQERASLREEFLGRIRDLNGRIGGLEKAICFEQPEYLRILADERKTLARLLAVRREQLLGEYARLPQCGIADRPCLDRKLKMLCKLKLLFSPTERVPILHLIQEVDGQLNVTSQPASKTCGPQDDFGL